MIRSRLKCLAASSRHFETAAWLPPTVPSVQNQNLSATEKSSRPSLKSKSISWLPYSFDLSGTSQQYFSLVINRPSAINQQYFSLRTNQYQPSVTSQTNMLLILSDFLVFSLCYLKCSRQSVSFVPAKFQ
jgi:hypothetical protein